MGNKMGNVVTVYHFIDDYMNPKPLAESTTTWINKSIDVEVECEDINCDLTKFSDNQSLIYENIL